MAIAVTVNKKTEASQNKGASFAEKLKRMNSEGLFRKKVKSREVLFFTSQLSLMLEIGTPLNESLAAIAEQMGNPELKRVLLSLLDDVEDGKMLSESMKNHPRIFSSEYVSLISAGENSGSLQKMLDRAVELQEKREEFVTALKGAMTYPMVLCIITVLVILFMLTFVFPRFAILFDGAEEILPPTTKFLMALSHLLRSYWYGVPLLIGTAWMALRHYLKTEHGRFAIDRLKISVPLISAVTIQIYLSQLLRTLGFLMGSNVPLLEALIITKGGSRNLLFTKFIEKIEKNVEEGKGFSQAFRETPFIPGTVSQMIRTGEDSQKLDMVMIRLSDYYEGEIKAQIKKLTTIIEPLLLIFMGIVVGLIVVSLILPIFKLSKVVH